MAKEFSSPNELLSASGCKLGTSNWLQIDQDRIDMFAEATGDHQWIHVDQEAAKKGPFETTIAHGYLTLSLVSQFLPQIIKVEGIGMGINVGCNRVRFPSPVPVGSKIRAHGELVEAESRKGGIQAVIRVTVEIEGVEKPACVADTVSLYFPV